jgi:predicted ABC-type ATPase
MPPVIYVLAGVNGAGKSSIGGEWLISQRLPYFNPDQAAREIREQTGGTLERASSLAWTEGKRLLEVAIANRHSHAFETTLGGNTMAGLLHRAASEGIDVLMWFAGLANVEHHVARVKTRVAAGGHDIPEETIRRRFDTSRRNLIALLPSLTELRLFDNSAEAAGGIIPPPRLLLHWKRGRIIAPGLTALETTPEWAKSIVARAMQLHAR